MDTKRYVEYLDKEMTIMGILSAVCVAAPAGILSAVLAKDSSVGILFWSACQFFIVAGSSLCVLAAFFFYKERSQLAWYYGQICLAELLTDKAAISAKLREWLREADSWETWLPYCWGFTFLVAGFSEYLLAAFFVMTPPHWPWLLAHLHIVKLFGFFACPIIAVLSAVVQWYVRTRYRFNETPWTDFLADMVGPFKGEKTLPHDGVYTRLKPSAVHGAGVFAIAPIAEGTYLFEPDNDALSSISVSETEALAPSVRKLYQDFCVQHGDNYECPSNFNKLTPAWFLNGSKNPNVAADLSLNFYAIRDIEEGEELTVDYETYSENELDISSESLGGK
jgi:uncharacterized protein